MLIINLLDIILILTFAKFVESNLLFFLDFLFEFAFLEKMIYIISMTQDINKNNSKNSILKLQNLPQKQKLIFASILTFASVLIIFLASLAFSFEGGSLVFKVPFADNKTEYADNSNNKEQVLMALNELESKISSTDPEELIVEEITFEELQIYPVAWVEKHFTENERRNPLISGPNADSDGDGLINRLEYLYSSSPKNSYSLCAKKTDEKDFCDKTDKENVDNGISPLTGLKIQEVGKLIITRQDRAIAQELGDSMVMASEAGVDFPEIYQLSGSLDLTKKLDEIELKTVEDNRSNLLEYIKLRSEFLEDFAESGTIFGFSEIYKLVDSQALLLLKESYQGLLQNFEEVAVPKSQEEFHRTTVFSLQKAVELIQIRIDTLDGKIADTDEQVKKNKEKSVELVWGFRRLSEITAKLD